MRILLPFVWQVIEAEEGRKSVFLAKINKILYYTSYAYIVTEFGFRLVTLYWEE